MSKSKRVMILAFVMLCQLTGVVGAVFTTPATYSDWFLNLEKPFFYPPNWLFGPVWMTLYTLMGVALYLVYSKGTGRKIVKAGMVFFIIHLFFNGIWSFLFFKLQNPGLALLDLSFLIVFVTLIIAIFYRISKASVYFLLPYLLWICFAFMLNFEIWRLN